MQADLKTFSALGVYGATAITAVTVQNTVGVKYVHALPPQVVYDQIVTVMEDIMPDAVKIGMVNDAETLDAIVRALTLHRPRFLVVDPVMVSTSGCALMQADALQVMKERLLPMADIVTPNLPEAWTLAGTDSSVDEAAQAILRLGVKALLIKGGHAEGKTKTDYLYVSDDDGVKRTEFSSATVDTFNTHGTGCTLSSAIAAMLARGHGMEEAVRQAKMYLTEALKAGADVVVGHGHGPVCHFYDDAVIRYYGYKVIRSSGSEVIRSSGPEVIRSSGSEVIRSSGSEVIRSSGPEVIRSSGSEVIRSSGPEVIRSSGSEVIRSSGPEVIRSSGPEVIRSSGSEVIRSSGPEVIRSSGSEVIRSSGSEVIRSSGSEVIRSSGYKVIRSYGYKVIRSSGSEVIRSNRKTVKPNNLKTLKSKLQFITHFTDRYSYLDSAMMALEGGCRWIQLRMKNADEAEIERTARQILPECRRRGAVFIIDDHVELVKRVGADGVHLGKNDMPVDEARRILGDEFIIGGTANTFEDIQRLAAQGADYIGCGPFRFTTTKKNLAPMLGIEGYENIVSLMKTHGINLPIVAIGGITYDDIPRIMSTGVTGIAISGSVLRADNPVEEMRKIAIQLRVKN